MWPFSRKKNKKKKQREELFNALNALTAQPPCPPEQIMAKVCVCMECKKRAGCVIEDVCHRSGCENIIRACSIRTPISGKKGALSDFGDNVAMILVHRMLKDMGNERHYQEARKSMLARLKEEEDAKKEVRGKGSPNGEGPPGSM